MPVPYDDYEVILLMHYSIGEEARRLLDSIKTDTVVGLRDRAFIALLVYTFARVSAAVHMNVEDVYVQGKRTWVRLHEKGGKEHTLPCHHELEAYLLKVYRLITFEKQFVVYF